jgi:F-type H+-transporting ATPase subunit delta
MKIPREAQRLSRQLFRACQVDGRLDEERVRTLVKALVEKKPRHHAAVLHRLKTLVEIDVARQTFSVDSAVPIADEGAAIFADLEQKFGKPLATRYGVDPTLLGGVRIQVGSNVWDGSVRQRLRSLQAVAA